MNNNVALQTCYMSAMPSMCCALQSSSGQRRAAEPVVNHPEKGAYPSMHHPAPRVGASAQAPDSAASIVGPAHLPVSLQNMKREIAAYTADLLASNSGEEVSFEEVRAAKWLDRQVDMAKQVMPMHCLSSSFHLCLLHCHMTTGLLPFCFAHITLLKLKYAMARIQHKHV